MKIFLTVGTQLPFDRLVKAMDMWCAENPDVDVFGQIAEPGESGYKPSSYKWQSYVEPEEFNEHYDQASLVVGHAGMGSIISALTNGKPILIMPRSASLGEHRNDHQLATAARFKGRQGITVVENEQTFSSCMDGIRENLKDYQGGQANRFADERLLETLRSFIHE